MQKHDDKPTSVPMVLEEEIRALHLLYSTTTLLSLSHLCSIPRILCVVSNFCMAVRGMKMNVLLSCLTSLSFQS